MMDVLTCEEVLKRSEEYAKELGDKYGRLQKELLTPLITSMYNAMEIMQSDRTAAQNILYITLNNLGEKP